MALPLGKLAPELLASLLAEGPPLPPEVLVGPRVGEDGCAIEIGGQALVVAADPITLTGAGAGAHAVWINANDVAVMGARPRWFLATLLLPEGCGEDTLRALFTGMRQELAGLGASLVGGHTEVTRAVRQPVVAGQMLGVCEAGRAISTGGARAGEALLQIGPAPIEAAAVLWAEASDRLAVLTAGERSAAANALAQPGICVVEPALLLAARGATSLHDPTEGGLSAGLHELADASGHALEVDEDAVLWFAPGRGACRALGADPWGALASGTLLATLPAADADAALRALAASGHAAARIGEVLPGRGVHLRGGDPLPRFDRDELSRVL